MSGHYRDYGYTSPGNVIGPGGRALTDFCVSIVSSIGKGLTVCDLGCGNGYLAAQLAKAGHDVTGVDASESGIQVARSHYQGERVDFVRADFDSGEIDSRLRKAPFDVVVSSDVIEHLYRPAALIEIARRILKSSGHFVVGTPYHGYLKNLAIAVAGKWEAHHGPNWDGGHIKFFAVESLRQLVEAHGFEVEGFRFHGRAPWLWKNMICIARKTGA